MNLGELDKINTKPAISEGIILKKRKTLLEYIPDAFKVLIEENQSCPDCEAIEPNSIALTAKLLDKMIELVSKDWGITVEELIEEFQLKKALGKSVRYYSIRQPEFLKGFFIYKGTRVDIDYILKVSGYKLEMFDYQRISRIPKDKLPSHFEYNESEDKYYYIYSNGVKKPLNICELYAEIDADISSENFQGYNTGTLEVIKTIISSRLLVCVSIHKISLNFLMSDIYQDKISDDSTLRLHRRYLEDYFNAIQWDTRVQWDTKKKWDSKQILKDYLSIKRPLSLVESVFYNTVWDSTNTKWDDWEVRWDDNNVSLSDVLLVKKDSNVILRDTVSTPKVITDIKQRKKPFVDFYRPANLLWDNHEKFDALVKKVYGNKWDLNHGYGIEEDSFLTFKGVKISDIIDVNNFSERLTVTRYDVGKNQIESRNI